MINVNKENYEIVLLKLIIFLTNFLLYYNGNKIYLGSDAHCCEEVGRFDRAIHFLNTANYLKELILNCNEDMLKNMFGR